MDDNPSNEEMKAAAQGFTVVVATAAQWGVMTASDFGSYRALILGDRECSVVGDIAAAEANKGVWGPEVDGNIVLVGTDPEWHSSTGVVDAGGDEVIDGGIAFAGDIADKTGLFATLSCYYHDTAAGTPVPVLDPFGAFTVTGGGCFDDAHKVADHPALAGITDAILSNWSCSVHEAFDDFPADFLPLAIAQGIGGAGSINFPDGTFGIPYILARGETLSPVACGDGSVDAGEECDDGNTDNGDGCSSTCQLEVCGDGVVQAPEECDDGNTDNGDGCSSTCELENEPPVTSCKSPTVNTDPGQCSASMDCGDIASCSDPDGDPTNLSCVPSGPYPVGTTFVEATCDDGQDSSAAFCSVAVVDNEAPVINCPANVTLPADGACQALYAGPSATATDNCGALVITSSPSLPAILGGLGNHTIDYTATDAAGNNSSCTQTIMVIDVTPPVVQFELTPLLPPPGDDDDDDDGGLDGNTQVNFSAVDNCSVPDLSAVLDIGCQQIDVSNGQIIDLECDDDCEVEAGDDDDDDDAGVSILEIEAQSVELIVTATDDSGNVGTCTDLAP